MLGLIFMLFSGIVIGVLLSIMLGLIVTNKKQEAYKLNILPMDRWSSEKRW